MITELATPEAQLYQLVIMAETAAEQDTESVDYMAVFDTPDADDTESDADQQRRDREWVF